MPKRRRTTGRSQPPVPVPVMLPPTEQEEVPDSGPNEFNMSWVLAGGTVIVALLVLLDLREMVQPRRPQKLAINTCQEVISRDAELTKEQLAKFLTVPERDQKQRVQSIVQQPYCQLPKLEVRSGVEADREAYPIKDDRKVQLVILYEGDEYAGYTISPR